MDVPRDVSDVAQSYTSSDYMKKINGEVKAVSLPRKHVNLRAWMSPTSCVELTVSVLFTGCPSKCLVCHEDRCDQCNGRSFLLDGRCVESCGEGYMASEETRVCEGG